MPSMMEEDDDRDLAGSQDGSSDNDMDETMRDADDMDVDADPESPSNSSMASESQNMQNPQVVLTQPSPSTATPDASLHLRPVPRPEAVTASTYDIVPTTAAPHSTSINAVAATADMRWVFSGGSDGYIRKFNWADSINSKLMLTVAQRHPFVDSVVKAGVLMTYWENMDGNALSPVYSLAPQSEGLWLLSGLESGGIRLQSVRHDEGKEIALLQQHTSAVSTLCLTADEQSLLSGSWDKKVFDWDLNTGQTRRTFGASVGQISAIEIRPESALPVPQESGEYPIMNGTFSSKDYVKTSGSSTLNGGTNAHGSGPELGQSATSPADSLFEADSLFGDDNATGDPEVPSGGAFEAEADDEMSQAITNGIRQSREEEEANARTEPDAQLNGTLNHQFASDSATLAGTQEEKPPSLHDGNLPNGTIESLTNGLPHAEDLESSTASKTIPDLSPESGSNIVRDTTFLCASIDGTIRVWDRRQPDPIARIVPRNTPPWCMNACWSPDGNYIYAGRRNGTVEEYSLHKGLREAQRTFKFPQGSGAVSALKAMPNGRHLICASHDILRLYDLKDDQSTRPSTVPFLIIPGHRTGTISQLYLDSACRYLISTSGNRGWEGATTEVLLGYEIGIPPL
ncbi:Transcription factor spt8 [Coccidioides posadasii str. Silveira]|uniref:Transcription factor n=2 Tax=Coccidioides posadasii TaxID=199306 RepID=E9DBQ9_COCPS|nr:WD domain, G-beta repeat containing protein [Coccidioides posadasii C735 delta SOWgp]EER27807.1 WD domain, G-beta repeat containing protein [Coccidioides posadasii C735 delta SOWgp]EFW16211.1 transcription factor [Coccidioides posadasii str. Silveira]QVM11437.1 Transcription factor spt8 [Coccidioides posadasii str. Silveira]|eukprot:XP_003069952.1 WD domain, G-beta repeat containing protein [Coccidioides posadasii C735 delta SOWgp]